MGKEHEIRKKLHAKGENAEFDEKKCRKVLAASEKFVPLHSQMKNLL